MSERTASPIDLHRPAWIDEFRAFIMRGNVVDLAVGIIIGVAFTAVVNSLVKDIFTPIIAVIQFLIVSFAVFWMIKVLTRLHIREEAAPAPPPPPPRSEVLLEEIRDLLAARRDQP